MSSVGQLSSEPRPYKLVSRVFHPEDSIIRVGAVEFGGPRIVVIAGPCAVESRTQVLQSAACVRETGVSVLRGGAYKPRTSPYSFQGLGREGLKILDEARQQLGLMVVTEAVDHESLELVAEWADMVQIGARNMQNFSLLKAVGSTKKPILLNRALKTCVMVSNLGPFLFRR